MTTSHPQLPIGYWLKHTDEVITRRVNQVLSEQGLTRFHWQVLNSVHESPGVSKAQVFETMKTFVDETQLDEIINAFVKKGWMVVNKNDKDGAARLTLTESGADGHRTILSLQGEVRKQAMQGVTEEEYATVIRVLQKMVSNLET